MAGASPFPRHWVYGDDGALVAKSGLTDFAGWSKECFAEHSPWGDVNSPTLITMAETGLERPLSTTIMRGGAKPRVRSLGPGEDLVVQGAPGSDLFLLLDGVLDLLVDGEPVAEVGPGAVSGERALLEGGTPALRELSASHRRQERATRQPSS